MIERLRVSLEDVAVALGKRKRVVQIGEAGGLQTVNGFGEFKVVEVPEDHDVRVRIDRADLLNESGLDRCLLMTPHFGRTCRRLEPSGERLVAALRVEVVRDDEKTLAIEQEFRGEWLAARVPSGVRRIDSPGAERELRRTAGARHGRRRGRVSAGPIHEREPTVGPEQEDLADVPAGLAAVLVVDGVDLPIVIRRSAGVADGGDERTDRDGGIDDAVVGRAVVVLHFLDGDEVRRLHVVHDQRREVVELRGAVARVEVLHIERRDCQLVDGRQDRDFFRERAGNADG